MPPDLCMRIGSETKALPRPRCRSWPARARSAAADPVGEYLDGVPDGDRIAVRELTGMRSGLFDHSEDDGSSEAPPSDPQRAFTPRRLIAWSAGGHEPHPVPDRERVPPPRTRGAARTRRRPGTSRRLPLLESVLGAITRVIPPAHVFVLPAPASVTR
ncbi:hypothetical protein [Streptomyces shenzhenensis]|uniref:hypothetical protein n=1 Tax=Streptomyces shenzhenensis TaxID=943815 RepID=UPI0015F0B486|nr:hypothetical protein [Streptomyces shenzhenensis]